MLTIYLVLILYPEIFLHNQYITIIPQKNGLPFFVSESRNF